MAGGFFGVPGNQHSSGPDPGSRGGLGAQSLGTAARSAFMSRRSAPQRRGDDEWVQSVSL